MQSERRPRLSPVVADVRRAVRGLLPRHGLVLVGLSGGADSLALAAATAFEAPRAGLRAGAVIIDHAVQPGSAAVAAQAARQARGLGLDPVLVVTVRVSEGADGPEAHARAARYDAFDRAVAETGAVAVLLGHTLDDQAETVLLGLARGSGPTSLHGMAPVTGPYRRPLLGIRRDQTRQFCRDAALDPWQDPQNRDPRFARVRARQNVLPALERELGPGIAAALARTAEQLREDAAALDGLVPDLLAAAIVPADPADPAGPAEPAGDTGPVVRLRAQALGRQPAALRQRMIRLLVAERFGVSLGRSQTLGVAELVTNWHGQEAIDLAGVRVIRRGGDLVFFPAAAHPPI
ncbi:MAG: tRNA lysidine(34) synthetase TilS [Cryobacterium sp.]